MKMMRRLVSFVLALCLLASMLPTVVFAQEQADTEVVELAAVSEGSLTSDDGKWSFSAYESGVQLTAYHGNASDVYVPVNIEADGVEYPVIKLADSLFADNDSLNSVTLGEGILEIGAKVFYDCDNLVCIVTSETLTTIGAEAFYSCDSFNSVILYDSVSAIAQNAFAECPCLTIWCNENTAAYTFATENTIPYEILNPNATPETYIQDGVTYYIMNGEAVAIAFDGNVTMVEMPAEVDGKPVTEIRGTFMECDDLISVTLPKTLQTIGQKAFYSCSSLQSVTIPEGVTSIDSSAFYLCRSLQSISIPESVTSIGAGVFSYCSSLQSISIPENVTVIGSNAFSHCSLLQCITIPESVTSIGSYAFSYCSSLQSITIPENVTSIGSGAFSYCSSLQSIEFSEGLKTIEGVAFHPCIALQTVILPKSVLSMSVDSFSASAILLVYKNSYAHTFAESKDLLYFVYNGANMPQLYTVDGISYYVANGSAVAYNCDKAVTTVEMPAEIDGSPVTELRGTFMECDDLVSITLPETLQTIGQKAFNNCRSLQSIIIPESVTSIEYRAFFNCCSLQGINIPESVTTISSEAFSYCSSLQSVSIPESVTSIGSQMFFSCTSLQSVTLPKSVTSIDYNAFGNCFSLQNITIPEKVTSIGVCAFSSCRSLQSITIPEGVTFIGSEAFSFCRSLQSITIPEGVTSINSRVFESCSSLQSIIIPESATSIGFKAFYSCSALQTVILPKNVVSMSADSFPVSAVLIVYENSYAHTFAESKDFLYFVYNGTGMPQLYTVDGVSYCVEKGSAVAYNCDKAVTTVEIPAEVDSYPVTELRGTFMECDNLVSITLPETLQTIGQKAFSYCRSLQNITIPESVTSIGAEAFYICSSLKSITIPESVTSIECRAFYSCSSLQSVAIPESVTFIGAEVFSSCSALQSITIPESVTSIEYRVFYSCSSLQSVTIPESVTTIGAEVFYNCRSLQNITLHESVKSIGISVFYGCRSLQNITIPESITSIGSQMFAGCSNLQSITIPENVFSIGYRAFSGCSNLQSITIPESVTSIGAEAFYSCSTLQSVTIPENVFSIGYRAFSGCSTLQSVTIPESVTFIGEEAFYKCSALQTVILPKSISSISVDSFPDRTIHMVYENSYAHTFAKENDLLYFVLRETENPEVHFGTGISGVVTYTDGTAANGAIVKILYDDGTVKETVTTETDGSYAFTYAEVGRYTIKVTDASGNTASTQVAVKRMNAFDVFVSGDTTLTLKKGYSVSGQVNIPGATVTITDQESRMIGSVVADENVNFVFENIPNGTYIVTAKTDSGSVSQEITVFDGSVSGIILNIASETATIWGYTAVQDRKGELSNRNWVQVTAYNADGIAVAQCKSNKDGKYTFSGLPLGQYAIVAEATEMRTEKNNKFERSYTLTGYAYVAAGEAAEYQADIVLYEENDKLATVSGKVTAHGEKQISTVTLRNVFRHEIASYQTKSNGKYSFSNVRDGLYFITAVTESDGMGYAVIVVRDGVVHGQTDITVLKSDKVKDREDKFNVEVPQLNGREEALAYRTRIADEKRFYDSLSEKEKKQLSKDYIERLNRYAEWIAETDYNTDDGVTVVQGGLVVSGDELDSGYQVDFNITVEKVDRHTASTDGVHNRDDFIYHTMDDVADHQSIQQCYEISMSKTVNGEEKQITSVYKDTNATGKFRIVLEIPEEYRGYKHYSMLHDHCGEVVKLADLDDDPNTITIEVDAFSTFVMTATNENLTGCEHMTVENGVCADCGETFGVAVVDGEGNDAGIYATLAEALDVAVSGQTVQLRADVSMDIVILTSGVDLDLNGHTLTVNSVQTYKSTNVVDSAPSNNGLLKINDAYGNMIDQTNTQLPVYDSEYCGYRFFTVSVISHTITGKNNLAPKYWFKVEVENLERFNTLILAGSEVVFKINMTWEGQTEEISAVADLAFTQTWAQKNVSGNTYITVSVDGSGELDNFSLTPCVTSGGVELSGTEM